MKSLSTLSYQRDAWARLVFGSEFGSPPGDFNAKESALDVVAQGLRNSEARVRMKAIVTLALRKDVPEEIVLAIGELAADEDEWDYQLGRATGPSRWVPKVSVCVETFLPVIGQKSPEAILKIIQDVSVHHAFDKATAIQTLVGVGVPAVAGALVKLDPTTQGSLVDFKAAFVQEKDRIQVKTEDQMVNATSIPQLVDRFLEAPDKRISAVVSFFSPSQLYEFIAAIIDSGEVVVPWLVEAIQYQTDPKLTLELAEKLGPNAVPALITALSSPKSNVRRTSSYALALLGKGSPEAKGALEAAVDREKGWWTRRALRKHLKQIKKNS